SERSKHAPFRFRRTLSGGGCVVGYQVVIVECEEVIPWLAGVISGVGAAVWCFPLPGDFDGDVGGSIGVGVFIGVGILNYLDFRDTGGFVSFGRAPLNICWWIFSGDDLILQFVSHVFTGSL